MAENCWNLLEFQVFEWREQEVAQSMILYIKFVKRLEGIAGLKM